MPAKLMADALPRFPRTTEKLGRVQPRGVVMLVQDVRSPDHRAFRPLVLAAIAISGAGFVQTGSPI